MTEVRENAPKGTVHTQLRPGEDDYVPWIKVAYPHGSGRYEQKKLNQIDPENTAARFDLEGYNPTKRTDEEINRATAISRNTLVGRVEEDSDSESSEHENAEGETLDEATGEYTTVSRKRGRSSPGEAGLAKMKKGKNYKMVKNLYKDLGLSMHMS